jgi:hypothetical protein
MNAMTKPLESGLLGAELYVSSSSFPGKMELKVEGGARRGQARAMERVWQGEPEQRGRVFSFSTSEVPGIYHKWRDMASRRLRELPTRQSR